MDSPCLVAEWLRPVTVNCGQDGKYKRTSRYQSTRSCGARVELHTRREARFEMFHEPARRIRYHPSGIEGSCAYWLVAGLPRGLTLVAPFADEMEAALEERVVVGRWRSSEREDGGGEGRCVGSVRLARPSQAISGGRSHVAAPPGVSGVCGFPPHGPAARRSAPVLTSDRGKRPARRSAGQLSPAD